MKYKVNLSAKLPGRLDNHGGFSVKQTFHGVKIMFLLVMNLINTNDLFVC